MFDHINSEINRSIIALMINMSLVDGFSVPIEEAYIRDIAHQFGIANAELQVIVENPDRYAFEAPTLEKDRMTILYYLLFTMRADGDIEEREVNYLHDMGLKLGIQPALIGDMIDVMRTYAQKEIPPTVMIEQIKKYLN